MQYGLLEQIDSINVDTVEKNLHQSSVVGSFLNYFMSSNSSLHTLEILKKSKDLNCGLGRLWRSTCEEVIGK